MGSELYSAVECVQKTSGRHGAERAAEDAVIQRHRNQSLSIAAVSGVKGFLTFLLFSCFLFCFFRVPE